MLRVRCLPPLPPLLLLLCGLCTGCDRPPPATPAQVVALLDAPLPQGALAARVQRGEALYYANSCSNCHVLKGPARGAPRLARLYHTPAQLVGGQTRVRDRAYLARSILASRAEVVAGYTQQMSVYRHLPAGDVAALIAFLETYSPPPRATASASEQPHASQPSPPQRAVQRGANNPQGGERRSPVLP